MGRLLKPQLVLLFSFITFVILSWVLLFRDERALAGIGDFYPSISGTLVLIREWLLSVGLNTVPTLLFGLLALASFGAYFFSLINPITKSTSIAFALIFQAIIFFSYPILSTDIFSYIYSDRVFTEYGDNVWKVIPLTFPNDPYEVFADWKDETKVYGVVNQFMYLPASYIGGENLFVTVVLYKLTAVVFAIATIFLFSRLVSERSEVLQARAIRLLFWSPLFVLEIAGSGHNDIAMIFFFLLCILLYWKKMWVWAGLALALSVQVKLIMGVFLVFAVVDLLRKKDWKAVLKFTGGFAAVNLLAFGYMQVSPFEFLNRVLYNTSVYWQSLPALVQRFWESEKLLFTPLLIVTLAGAVFWQWRKKVEPLLVTTIFLLLYLLFFSAAYWNWYVLWVLVAVPFIKVKWLQVMIVAFSFTSLCAYPLLWLSHRFGYNNIGWSFVYYGWIFVIPVIFTLLIEKNTLKYNKILKLDETVQE